MTKITYLEGTYNIEGSYLIHTSNPTKLLMTSRVQTTGKKPVKFLLNKTDKNGSYISSMYSVSDNTGLEAYNFDYKGVAYVLVQLEGGGQIEIKQR